MATPAPGRRGKAAAPAADPEIEVMARNGITRVPAHQYHIDGYRYAKLGDALAQAARGRKAAT